MNRTHPYKLALGDQAHRLLVIIMQRNHVEPEPLLRVIVESTLCDVPNEPTLEECIVEDARLLKVPGAFEQKYWKSHPLRQDGLTLDLSEGQAEAPDDVPVWVPPATYWRHRSIMPGKHRVTVEFNEAAYAGLVLLKEYDERESIEDVIYADLGGAAKCMAECREFRDWLEEQFGLEE